MILDFRNGVIGTGMSSREVAHIIVTATLTINFEGIFDFQNRLSATANQNRQQRHLQEVGSYLRKSMRNQHQTLNGDSELSPEDVQTIWCHVITGRGHRKQKCVLANNC